MSVAHDYLAAIVRRPREEMEPKGFVINWADKPRHAKFYRGTDRFALPAASAGPPPYRGRHAIFAFERAGEGGF